MLAPIHLPERELKQKIRRASGAGGRGAEPVGAGQKNGTGFGGNVLEEVALAVRLIAAFDSHRRSGGHDYRGIGNCAIETAFR
jgi:hypothetical protein